MANRNIINSNFYEIANTDVNGDITGITTGNVTSNTANVNYANLVYSNLTETTVTGNISIPGNANIVIGGGQINQFLQTDGNGNLSWSNPFTSGIDHISNGSSNVRIPVQNGPVFIASAGSPNVITITGNGTNSNITANGFVRINNINTANYPANAARLVGALQVAGGATFGGAVAAADWLSGQAVRLFSPFSGTGVQLAPNIEATANLSFTLPSTYGSNAQVLATDGTGNLVWLDGTPQPLTLPAIHFDVIQTANNQQFSNTMLAYYPANTDIVMFRNGALMNPDTYQLNGSVLTINTQLNYGDNLDIIRQDLRGIGGNVIVANTNYNAIPAIHFDVTQDGNNQAFANDYLSDYAGTADLNLFLNGAYLNSNFFQLVGNTLTITTPLKFGDSIDIARAVANAGTGIIQVGGPNTAVQFNDANTLGGTAGFTFTKTNNTITVGSNIVTNNFVFSSNAADATANFVRIKANGTTANYTLYLPAGTGAANQVLTTDGSGVLTWTTPSDPSRIANGNSNVRIATANGNVSVSVRGNADLYTFTPNSLVIGNASISASNANVLTLVGDAGSSTGISIPSANASNQFLTINSPNTVTITSNGKTTTFNTNGVVAFPANVTANTFIGNVSGGNVNVPAYSVNANNITTNNLSVSNLYVPYGITTPQIGAQYDVQISREGRIEATPYMTVNSVNQTTSITGTLIVDGAQTGNLSNPQIFTATNTGLNFTGVAFTPAVDATNSERFFASTSGQLFMSVDGHNWSKVQSPAINPTWNYTGIAALGNAVVAITSDGNIVASTDRGQNWVDTTTAANLTDITVNTNGQWVAIGPAGVYASPPPGNPVTNGWVTRTLSNTLDFTAIGTINGSNYWLAAQWDGSFGTLVYSTDNGVTWQDPDAPGVSKVAPVTGIKGSGSNFFYTGGIAINSDPARIYIGYTTVGVWGFAQSYDSVLPSSLRFTSMTQIGNSSTFIYTGNDGNFYVSSGIQPPSIFTLIPSTASGPIWNQVLYIQDSYTYSAGGYVVAGPNGQIATSQTIASGLTVSNNANIGGNLGVTGNAIIYGNLTVQGNTIYANTETLVIEDPLIELGTGQNNTPLTSQDGQDRGVVMHTYGTGNVYILNANAVIGDGSLSIADTRGIAVGMEVGFPQEPSALPHPTTVTAITPNVSISLSSAVVSNVTRLANINIGLDQLHYMGWDTSNVEFAFGSNVTVNNNVVTYNQLGNLRAANFIGDLYGNVIGTFVVNTLSNGNSNVRVYGNSNISFTAGGNGNIFVVTPTGVVSNAASFIVNDTNAYINSNNAAFVDHILDVGTLANGAFRTTADAKDYGIQFAQNSGNTLFAVSAGNAGGFNQVTLTNPTGYVAVANGDSFVFSDDVANTYTVSGVTANVTNTTFTVTPSLQATINNGSNAWLQRGQSLFLGWSDNQSSYVAVRQGALQSNGNIYINQYGNVKAYNFNATNGVTIPAIAGFSVGGGSNGQIITTDGAGNLSWRTISTSSISNGNSNVQVFANANITFGSGGVPNVFGVTPNGAYLNANLLSPIANGNSNITITSSANVTLTANAVQVANVVADGTGNYAFTGINVAGYVNALGNVSAVNFFGTLANGNSNVRIAGNSNVSISANGISNIVTVTGDGGNSNANGITANGFVRANVFGVYANGYNINIIGNASQTSNYTMRLPTNLGTNNQVFTTDGAGNTFWGTFNRISNGNTFVQTYDNSNVTITATDAGGNAYSWIFNANGTMDVPAHTIDLSNQDAVIVAEKSLTTSYSAATPVTTLGSINYSNVDLSNSGVVTTLTGGNGTSNVGTSRVMSYTLNANGTGNFRVDGSAYFSGAVDASTRGANLGAVANVKIANGVAGQILTTDGAGNLTWSTPVGSTVPVTNISKANPGVVTTNGGHNLYDGAAILITGVVGMTEVNGQPYYAKVTGFSTTTFGLYNDAALTSAVDTTSYTTYVSGGTVATRVAAGNTIVNGNSNVFVNGNSNVNFNVAGNANVLTVTGNGFVLGANATRVLMSNATNIQLGAVGNLHISGGSNGQAIVTDGNGNLSFANTGSFVQTTTNSAWYNASVNNASATQILIQNDAGGNVLSNWSNGTQFILPQYSNSVIYTVTNQTQSGGPTSGFGSVTFTPGLSSNTTPPTYLWVVAGTSVTRLAAGNNMSISIANSVASFNANTSNLGLVENLIIQSNVTGTVSNASPGAVMEWNGSTWQFAPVLHYKAGVKLATTGNLNATYNNGSSGVGATLTNAGANAALQIDSTSVVVGDRILVKDQTNGAYNGAYSVTVVGAADSPGPGARWVLTRTTDYDTPQEMLGQDVFYVSNGSVNQNASFVQLNYIATVGTTALVFESAGVATFQTVTAAANTTSIGITVSNAADATTTLTGAAVIGNTNNANFSTGIGNGNIYTGGILSVGGNVTVGNSSTPAAQSATVYSSTVAANTISGAFVVGNTLNANLSTAIGNGVVLSGNGATFGLANASASNAAYNSTVVQVNSIRDAANTVYGAFVVGNVANTLTTTAFGLGNIKTGGNLTVGTLTSNAANNNVVVQINSTVNAPNSLSGALFVTGTANNYALSTAIGNGNIQTGTSLTVGGANAGLANGPAQLTVYSTTNASDAATGGFIVTANTANKALSVAIGNGTIQAGAAVNAGNVTQLRLVGDDSSSATVLRSANTSSATAAVSINYFTSNGALHNFTTTTSAGGNANTVFSIDASNTVGAVLTSGNGAGLSNLYLATTGSGAVIANIRVNSTAANVGSFLVGNISNANASFAVGNGNVFVGAGFTVGITSSNLAVGSGQANIYSTVNATAPNVGGLLVSSNTANPNVSVAFGSGNGYVGGNLQIGTGANSDANAALNASTLKVISNVNSTASAGGFIVTGNIANAALTTAVGNGNVQTGGTITISSNTSNANITTTVGSGNILTGGTINVSSNTSNANITTTIGNGNITTGGTLTVSSNSSNANLVTTVFNGNIFSGGNVQLGTGLNSNANAAVNASKLTIYSNINSNSTTGGLVVTGNISNVQLTTTIGNGNIYTGNTVYAGGAGNVFGGAVSTSTGLAVGSNAAVGPDIRINGANSQYGGMMLMRAGTERWYIGADSSSANGNVVIRNNGNLSILTISEVVGGNTANSGNVYFNGAKFAINRGNTANLAFNGDEYLTIGAKDAGSNTSPVIMGIQSANTTYSGVRWTKAAGSEQAFWGFDNTSNIGNIVLNTGSSGQTFFVQTGNSSRNDYGVSRMTKGFAYYNANQVTISSGVDTKLTAFTVSGTDTTGLDYSSGVWTNNTGRTIQLMVTIQSGWDANTTGARVHFLAPSNPGSGGGGANRFAMVDAPCSPDFPVYTTTAVHQMANGDVFTIWVWQNSGASRTYGGVSAGMSANASSRVNIVVL